MRYLIIVHLEPDFEATAGPLNGLVDKVVKYSYQFDKVLNITSAEGLTGTQPFPKLTRFESKEWIWGLDIDYYQNEPDNPWIEGDNYIPTTGHPYSEIHDWMKDLPKDAHYTLVGGSRYECLKDIYEIWQHLGLKTRIKEALTY